MTITKDQLITLSRLLDDALELSEDARAAWLDDTTSADSQLKPLLRDLLAKHGGAETHAFLHTLPKFTTGIEAGESSAFTASILEGQTIGPYRLIREIGHGGMSTVWLATRSDGEIKRPVALKLPHVYLNRQQFVER